MGLARMFPISLTSRPCTLISFKGVHNTTKALEIVTTANQDPLLTHSGVDIWEHAFYLQYKNVKADVSLSQFLFMGMLT